MDWLDLLAVQGTLKSLLQHHSSKASILRCSAFFTVQLSHPYMTTGKTIALTRRTKFVPIFLQLPWETNMATKKKGVHFGLKMRHPQFSKAGPALTPCPEAVVLGNTARSRGGPAGSQKRPRPPGDTRGAPVGKTLPLLDSGLSLPG